MLRGAQTAATEGQSGGQGRPRAASGAWPPVNGLARHLVTISLCTVRHPETKTCHDSIVLPYAAYLRVYEPLTAFTEPDRSRWASYAASAERPRRVGAIEAEHEQAVRRLIAVPPIVAPACESDDAYVRRADGTVYICPWQTRLRSWLALGRLRATLPPSLTDTFVPRRIADVAAADFARWHSEAPSIRTHILTSTWHVPLAWFVPFGPPERWLVLGGGAGSDRGQATAAVTRMLIYVTTMAQARRRVARALGAVRRGLSPGSHPYHDEWPDDGYHADADADNGDHGGDTGRAPADGAAPHGAVPRRGRGRHASGSQRGDTARHGRAPRHGERSGHADTGRAATAAGGTAQPAAAGEIAEVGRWLEEFHPRSLVELDYGGLVHMLDDGALRADQSVAEVAAAITGLETGELELAVAMYQRLRNRWRAVQATESAS